jgi:AmmeMemoRadiSam system protein A
MKETLNQEERNVLFTLAREAIACAVSGDPMPEVDLSTLSERLRQPGASFVTLLGPGGELRGCIGSIEAHTSLAQDVQNNAVGSAMRDPRFPAVRPRELQGLKIELSILTAPQPLDFDGPDDLLSKIRPGVDGLIIEKNWHRATLLPSVWEKIPDPVEFMFTLCRKAGLPQDEWRRPGMTVYVYQAEKVEQD